MSLISKWAKKGIFEVLLLAAVLCGSDAAGQSVNWSGFGSRFGGVSGDVRALLDDGAGGMYLAGAFASAGGTEGINSVAHWDGQRWSALNGGIDGLVNALTRSESGLFAGGAFETVDGLAMANIARWHNGAWSSLGSGVNGAVHALAWHNGELYAGGEFTEAGGQPASGLARWDGSSWQAVGGGVSGGAVFVLKSSAQGLLVGGSFSMAGAVPAARLALWNGTEWQTLGTGVNGSARSLAIQQGVIYVGGDFTEAGGQPANRVAKWDGTQWSALGTGCDGRVSALEVDAGGVWAGGNFLNSGGISTDRIARWNGTAWQAVGTGMNREVFALVSSGGRLWAGGRFSLAGNSEAERVATWEGSRWDAVGAGLNSWVTVVAVNPETGDVVAGGNFVKAGGRGANRVARWDGARWQSLGEGFNGLVRALAHVNGDLYAAGDFTQSGAQSAAYVARWTGTAWVPVGGGVSGPVRCLTAGDGLLYVGGSFTSAGGAPANRIACWTGSSWQNLGTGVGGAVAALDYTEGKLFVGGNFADAGGQACGNVAVWNGSAWSAVGTGVDGPVNALSARGDSLFVGGEFASAGGVAASGIAHWNGSAWSPLGAGVSGPVYALLWAGDNKLFVGGNFEQAGGQPASRLAVWQAGAWSAMGDGANAEVLSMAASGSDLVMGGSFDRLGNETAYYAGLAENVISPFVLVSPPSVEWTQQGGTHEVEVLSNTAWNVVVAEPWVQASLSSGNGPGKVTFIVSQNTGLTSRTSQVQVGTAVHTILQSAVPPTYMVQPLTRQVASSGENYVLNLESNGSWTVEDVPSWVTVTPETGTGNAALQVEVSPFGIVGSRSALLRIGSATHEITQNGVPPMLEISTEQLLVPSTGGPFQVDIVANQPWSVTEQADWIEVDTLTGEGNGQLTLTVASNVSAFERINYVDIGVRRLEVRQSGVAFASQLQVGQPYQFVFGGVTRVIKVSGLPPGLTYNAKTATLSGRATRSGPVRITVQYVDLEGTRKSSLFLVQIDPLPEWAVGGFIAEQPRNQALNLDLGGLVECTLTKSGSGSGRVSVAGKNYAFRGQVYSDGLGGTELRAEVRRGKLPVLALILKPVNGELVTGSLTLEGTPHVLTRGWKKVWHSTKRPVPVEQTGVFNVLLDLDTAYFDVGSVPQGAGFLRAQVSSSGSLRWTGQMGDGTAVTATSHLGPGRQWMIWRSLYGNTGSVKLAGVKVASDSIEGSGDWLKKPQPSAKIRHYREGFFEEVEGDRVPVSLELAGGRWVPMPRGGNLPGLTPDQSTAMIEFQSGGVAFSVTEMPNLSFTLDALSRPLLPVAGSSENPGKTRLKVDRATGLFSGDFQLSDNDPERPGRTLLRRVSYSGLITSGLLPILGGGNFRLNQLASPPLTTGSNSPQLSGVVSIRKLVQ